MEIETGKGGWQGDGQEKRNGNMEINKKANKEAYATYHFRFFVSKPPMGRLSPTSVLAYFAISLRKPKVYLHDTTLRSQNAEQLRENGWLRCSRKPQSFKTYDSSEFGVWSSYTVREAYKPLNLRKATKETIRSKAMKTPKTTNVKISKTSKLNTVSCLT